MLNIASHNECNPRAPPRAQRIEKLALMLPTVACRMISNWDNIPKVQMLKGRVPLGAVQNKFAAASFSVLSPDRASVSSAEKPCKF